MEKQAKCGNTPIRYPSECTYVCYCVPNGGCHWSVTCGDWTTSGTGLVRDSDPHPHPHTTVDGKLVVAAKILAKRWKRPVVVPPALRKRTIRRRTFKGTPAEVAQALGLQLKVKRRG